MWVELFRCSLCGKVIEMEEKGSWPIVLAEYSDEAWEIEVERHYPDCLFVRNRGIVGAGATGGTTRRDSSDDQRGDPLQAS